ncbi:aminotransferase class I/II-fold pyridoxal phosphate-dependent enzyme [Alkaliphilus oremlandii]|uniref:aminotransferase class I/II-fold pyridoxal phosphate-dependent enzyme n=1 Tax=Alkaliphilus oremlandii TaxID=461876 RepID=UPI0005A143AE
MDRLKLNQNRTPLFDALKEYINTQPTPFHVPGHKQGRGILEFRDYIGEMALKMDVNGMSDLDYFNNPTGVILESEKLYADAFGSEEAFFLVNGTSSGVQAMILSTCQPGDEIIIPRNAHRSTLSGLILSGAKPIYVQPEINQALGIAMGVTTKSILKAIEEHPHAKAVFIINPTYYGYTSDLRKIVELAHRNHMAVLVDEAHGPHMYFHGQFPLTAMAAGADMSAASIHKTGGSLTQSSILLLNGPRIPKDRVRKVLDLMNTSSASYLLMCSLDVARKQLALNGEKMLSHTLEISNWAREEINKINHVYAFGEDLVGAPGCFDFDHTKLGIHVMNLGYTGFEIEDILRKQYNIQVELADVYNILNIISLGDRKEDLERLISALKDISFKNTKRSFENPIPVPSFTESKVYPREAFYSPRKSVKIEASIGMISGETIMAYPPGIPILCMGEVITKEIIAYLKELRSQKCHIQGNTDMTLEYIHILEPSSYPL